MMNHGHEMMITMILQLYQTSDDEPATSNSQLPKTADEVGHQKSWKPGSLQTWNLESLKMEIRNLESWKP